MRALSSVKYKIPFLEPTFNLNESFGTFCNAFTNFILIFPVMNRHETFAFTTKTLIWTRSPAATKTFTMTASHSSGS